MHLFESSYGIKFILVAVDFVLKWVKVVSLSINEGRSVTTFLKKNIFSRFGFPPAIISDDGSHFCNLLFKRLLKKKYVKHNVATPYYPKTSNQVEVSNHEIRSILANTINTIMTNC